MLGFIVGILVGSVIGVTLTCLSVVSGNGSRAEEMHYSRIWRDNDEENNC